MMPVSTTPGSAALEARNVRPFSLSFVGTECKTSKI
jgi:hypothetical protein